MMKITLLQMNPTVGAIEENYEKVLKKIKDCQERRDTIFVTPELFLSGYPPLDLLFEPDFLETCEVYLNKLVEASKDFTLIIGMPRKNKSGKEKFIFNSAAVITSGKLLGFYDKQLLPTYDLFDEKRFFEPGDKNILWDLFDKKIAITICEDLWQNSKQLKDTHYSHDPIQELKNLNPDLVINLSASPYSKSKPELRVEVVHLAAAELGKPLFLCNQVGANDGILFDGHSIGMDQNEEIFVQAKGFVEDTVSYDFVRPDIHPIKNQWENLLEALVMGTRDYFHKLNHTKAVLGLSGGIDSALVAYIATKALGPKNVLAVLMPSRFSAQESTTDAIQLCKNLKIEFKEISIEPFFKTYLEQLSPHFENKPQDITEENLQARVRGMILMALSNKFHYFVLNTANKSELAIGYSTLYGDMCGALSILGDLYKTDIYELCSLINQESIVIPPNILQRPPSAELKENQKDSDTLPEYKVLDPILKELIENHTPIKEICKKHNQSEDFVRTISRNLHKNEYKRRQGPVILRVTEKALTPINGRSVPIVHKFI